MDLGCEDGVGVRNGISPHIVDVQRTVSKQCICNCCQALRTNWSSGVWISRDIIVLAEDATKTTGREEDGTTGNKRGLFTSVEKR